MAIIEIEKLTKEFNGIRAVDELTLSIPKGSIFGFLGPNGAGKTTTIMMLVGLIFPTSGEARILGESIHGKGNYLRRIGFLPEVPAFYNWMTAREYLTFVGELFKIETGKLKPKIEELLELVGLKPEKKRIGGYSRGMRQRLGLAQALINDPEIVFLDEPTSALDPIGRKNALDTIGSLKDRVTVFFSTHILSDVERVCGEVAILNKGKLITYEKVEKLRQKYGGNCILINLTEISEGLFDTLNSIDWIIGLEKSENTIKLTVNDTNRAYYELPKIFTAAGVGIIKLETIETTLEDIFVRMVMNDGD